MPTLALIVTAHRLTCYRQDEGQWRLAPLMGEASTQLGERAGCHVDAICAELHDPASIATARLCLLVDEAPTARAHAAELVAAALGAGIGRVDTRPLSSLASRARKHAPGSTEQAQWCTDYLLPELDEAQIGHIPSQEGEVASLRAEVEAARRDNRELTERFAVLQSSSNQQRADHREELAGLHARVTALAPPPIEVSVRFMPLFFRHFWEKVSPDDMAHVLRLAEAPTIPSPFPEPSGGALAALRRQFLGQPEPVRRAVLTLARDFGVNWEIRPDMLDLFERA